MALISAVYKMHTANQKLDPDQGRECEAPPNIYNM